MTLKPISHSSTTMSSCLPTYGRHCVAQQLTNSLRDLVEEPEDPVGQELAGDVEVVLHEVTKPPAVHPHPAAGDCLK